MTDVVLFSEWFNRVRLRGYQQQAARAIVDSVRRGLGLTFVVIFPRQSGKNELQAQLETYLLARYSSGDHEIVKVSPTWKPQSQNAMRRLERLLKRNPLAQHAGWSKEHGYIYRVGRARITFLSGSPTTNIVGATASLLLECDEAQDILPAKWDKEIAPMAASTNATRVFWGTAWTSQTLLAREQRAAEAAQARDGIRRVFVLTAEDVAREVPAYGAFVAGEIARHGRRHPMIRTQFFSEQIDGEGGMFPERRAALLRGEHEPAEAPLPGRAYAFLLDVAGEDEGAESGALDNPARDATALTIVEVDLAGEAALPGAPTYRIVHRRLWTGASHTTLYERLRALGGLWAPRRIVVDATGVGAGLASFLERAFPGRVIPFVFGAASKSKLGWDFLSLVEAGRLKDHRRAESEYTVNGELSEQALFYRQLARCRMEVTPGPERRLKWGVPDGTRDADGAPVHDDLVVSAALAALLDGQEWGAARSAVLRPADPLAGMRAAY